MAGRGRSVQYAVLVGQKKPNSAVVVLYAFSLWTRQLGNGMGGGGGVGIFHKGMANEKKWSI